MLKKITKPKMEKMLVCMTQGGYDIGQSSPRRSLAPRHYGKPSALANLLLRIRRRSRWKNKMVVFCSLIWADRPFQSFDAIVAHKKKQMTKMYTGVSTNQHAYARPLFLGRRVFVVVRCCLTGVKARVRDVAAHAPGAFVEVHHATVALRTAPAKGECVSAISIVLAEAYELVSQRRTLPKLFDRDRTKVHRASPRTALGAGTQQLTVRIFILSIK